MSETQLASEARCLPVPDKDSEAEFLKAAKGVWRRAHATHIKKGRKPEKAVVFEAIKEVLKDFLAQHGTVPANTTEEAHAQALCKKLTLVYLVEKVHARLPTLHVDTVHKYVKLFRLDHRSVSSITPAEWRWIQKHDKEGWKAHLDTQKVVQHARAFEQAKQELVAATRAFQAGMDLAIKRHEQVIHEAEMRRNRSGRASQAGHARTLRRLTAEDIMKAIKKPASKKRR